MRVSWAHLLFYLAKATQLVLKENQETRENVASALPGQLWRERPVEWGQELSLPLSDRETLPGKGSVSRMEEAPCGNGHGRACTRVHAQTSFADTRFLKWLICYHSRDLSKDTTILVAP